MKKIIVPFLYVLSVLAAGALLLYPMISNGLYENRQDGVIREYEAAVDDLDAEAEKLAVLEAAHGYNRQLATGVLSLDDPFLTPTLPENDGSQKSILDVTGTGVIASLKIPALDLELPIYYGTDSETLEHGIGVLEISSLPVGGEGTHTVLCGHSGLSSAKLFSDLELLRLGDRFSIEVMGDTTVDQITTVKPEDLSQLAIVPGEDHCTLLTCTPYGINTHRLLVRGTRTELPVITESTVPESESPVASVWLREYLTSIGIGVSVVAVLLILGKIITVFWKRRQK